MGIRSTAKALIINDGKILLNKCHDRNNGDYYSLPGGGQHKYETLLDAVIRECGEETGYDIKPLRFAALCEEICLDEYFREKYPEYAHKMYHIFLCELSGSIVKAPTEKDSMQIGCEWIEIECLSNVRLLPGVVGEHILDVLSGDAPIFLGSERIPFNHG